MPNMYTQAQGRTAPESKCGHIRQMPTARVTYVMYVILSALQNLPSLLFTGLPLYIMTGAVYSCGFLILTFL